MILLILCFCLFFYFRLFLSLGKWNSSFLILFFIITALVEIVWGGGQLYGLIDSQHDRFKITGSFFNPGPYGGYIAMILPLAFYYVLNDWTFLLYGYRKSVFIFVRYVFSFATCIGAFCLLPATMSRASWLAACGGCLFVFIFYLLSSRKDLYSMLVRRYRKRKYLVISLLLAILFAFLLGGYYIKKNSADGRMLIWKISVCTMIAHKQGVGLGFFSGYYGDNQADYFQFSKGTVHEEFVADSPQYAFNEYLQICVELGVLSFLLFLALVISTFYIGFKRSNIGPMGALISLLVFATMSYPFNILPYVISFVFLVALCVCGKTEVVDVSKKGTIKSAMLSIILFLMVSCTLHDRHYTYLAYKDWNKAKFLYHHKIIDKALVEYNRLYQYLDDQLYFLYEYSNLLIQGKEFEKANSILYLISRMSCDPIIYHQMGRNYQKMKLYDLTEQCY